MLDGQIAVVTGASRGIGRAIAIELAAQGAEVIVNYHGSVEKAQETVELIRSNGGKAQAMLADVSDFDTCKAIIDRIVIDYGRIDIWVNNAGITRDGLLMRMSEADFDRVIDTNLKGTFNCMRFVTRWMMKQHYGRIINLSSVSGVLGNPGQANYAASKAGIVGLTKTVAKEIASRNITVNAIAPGFVETDMTQILKEEVKDKAVSQIPMGRFGTVNEIAKVAAFLASPEASYITGQVICVDGGMS